VAGDVVMLMMCFVLREAQMMKALHTLRERGFACVLARISLTASCSITALTPTNCAQSLSTVLAFAIVESKSSKSSS
jgi:hypothetical protein